MSSIIDLATALLSTFILLVGAVTRPASAQCPAGFVVANVRTSSHVEPIGTFTCDRPALGGDTDVKTGKNTAVRQSGVLTGRIYCGVRTPILVLADREVRTVGCFR